MQGLEKLELRVYKYRELCELFGQGVKTHHSKEAQLKEWRRYFRWSNPTTQKYLVEEIYEKPLEKIDGRSTNGGNCTSKYMALDDIFMRYLEEVHMFEGTMRNLMIEVGVLSSKYAEYSWDISKLVSIGFPEGLINNVLWKISSNVINAGKSSIERLGRARYIRAQRFVVLHLESGVEKNLDESTSEQMRALEDEILLQMGKQRNDLYAKEVNKTFQIKMKFEIEFRFKFKIRYYYWKYHIVKNEIQYISKTDGDIRKLSRKFVKEICYSMLKIPYKKYVYSSDENCLRTIELMNIFFVYMNKAEWDKYLEDGELNTDEKMKDAVFFTQYCLTYYHADWWENAVDRKRQEEITERKEAYRQKAKEELDDESFVMSEEIIPDLDWERVFKAEEGDEYLNLCERTLDEYYRMEQLLREVKNKELVKAYSLHCARKVFEGEEDTTCPLWEFEKEYEMNRANEEE